MPVTGGAAAPDATARRESGRVSLNCGGGQDAWVTPDDTSEAALDVALCRARRRTAARAKLPDGLAVLAPVEQHLRWAVIADAIAARSMTGRRLPADVRMVQLEANGRALPVHLSLNGQQFDVRPPAAPRVLPAPLGPTSSLVAARRRRRVRTARAARMHT